MIFAPALFDRLVANIEIDEFTHCWTWTGPTRRHGGGHRPRVSIRAIGERNPLTGKQADPKTFNACRVMCTLIHGEPPDTDEVWYEASHLCDDNWLCCNPDHLLWETRHENMARRTIRQRNEKMMDLNTPGFKPGTLEAPF